MCSTVLYYFFVVRFSNVITYLVQIFPLALHFICSSILITNKIYRFTYKIYRFVTLKSNLQIAFYICTLVYLLTYLFNLKVGKAMSVTGVRQYKIFPSGMKVLFLFDGKNSLEAVSFSLCFYTIYQELWQKNARNFFSSFTQPSEVFNLVGRNEKTLSCYHFLKKWEIFRIWKTFKFVGVG